MLKTTLSDEDESTTPMALSLDEIARLGAQKLLSKALEYEVEDHISKLEKEKDSRGHRQVVRNGCARERIILTGSGEVKVRAPRVHDRREGEKFTSKVLPPYLRKSPNVKLAIPHLYLKGLSANDFIGALEALVGEGARGLSKSSIHALKSSWEHDLEKWRKEEIHDHFVYLWADGVFMNVRLGGDKKICLLVVMGVTEKGEKKLLAIQSGFRESKESWKSLFLDLQNRGLKSPHCLIGDGGLGLWAAISEMELFEKTKEQRCWFHKMGNVLNKLPKRIQPRAKLLLREMMMAETRKDAERAKKTFQEEFSLKYPKAVECLQKDWDKLTTFFDFPGAHWQHIRTTNPIESSFATVKLRTKTSKGSGSLKMAEVMAFKLMKEAEKRWRTIKGFRELPILVAGGVYKDGKLVKISATKIQFDTS